MPQIARRHLLCRAIVVSKGGGGRPGPHFVALSNLSLGLIEKRLILEIKIANSMPRLYSLTPEGQALAAHLVAQHALSPDGEGINRGQVGMAALSMGIGSFGQGSTMDGSWGGGPMGCEASGASPNSVGHGVGRQTLPFSDPHWRHKVDDVLKSGRLKSKGSTMRPPSTIHYSATCQPTKGATKKKGPIAYVVDLTVHATSKEPVQYSCSCPEGSKPHKAMASACKHVGALFLHEVGVSGQPATKEEGASVGAHSDIPGLFVAPCGLSSPLRGCQKRKRVGTHFPFPANI